MPRMRTIDQAVTYMQEIDENTALTKTALRRLVVNGTIPSVRIGKKYIVDLNFLEGFLSGELMNRIVNEQGTIRKIG